MEYNWAKKKWIIARAIQTEKFRKVKKAATELG